MSLQTYQLHIRLKQPCRLSVGKLGIFDFPAGQYIYTGSAVRTLEARIRRHMRKDKKLHWHIDYLLASPYADIIRVVRFAMPECAINRQTRGKVLIPGFGAGDCRNQCVSHLKYIG